VKVETFQLKQIRSPIRRRHDQRLTLIGLGLNRIGRVAEVPNTRSTWGMIAKVRHLVRIVDADLFEEHRLRIAKPEERVDKRLIRNLVFEPRHIHAKDIREKSDKTPDFQLLKDGALRAYCELKSVTDGDLFNFPEDLLPGQIRVEVRKDPAIFGVARLVTKAAKQLEAINQEHTVPNILVVVNHARRKGLGDLRMAMQGFPGPGGQRLFPLVNDDDGWEVQSGVWAATRTIDLYIWVNPRKRIWESLRQAGAARLAEACELMGIADT
jgi:ribosomal protein L30